MPNTPKYYFGNCFRFHIALFVKSLVLLLFFLFGWETVFAQLPLTMILPTEGATGVSLTPTIKIRTLNKIDTSSIKQLTPYPAGDGEPTILLLKTDDFLDTNFVDTNGTYHQYNGFGGEVIVEDSVTLRFDLVSDITLAPYENYTVILAGIKVIDSTGDTLTLQRTITNAFTTVTSVPILQSVSIIEKFGYISCGDSITLKYSERIPPIGSLHTDFVKILKETSRNVDTNGVTTFTFDTLATNSALSLDSTKFRIIPSSVSYEPEASYRLIINGQLLTGDSLDNKEYPFWGKSKVLVKVRCVTISGVTPIPIDSVNDLQMRYFSPGDTVRFSCTEYLDKYKFNTWQNSQGISIANATLTDASFVVSCAAFAKDSIIIYARYNPAEIDTLVLSKPMILDDTTWIHAPGLTAGDYGAIVTGFLDSLGNGKYTFPRTPYYPVMLKSDASASPDYVFEQWVTPTDTVEWAALQGTTEMSEMVIPLYTRASLMTTGINGRFDVGQNGRGGPQAQCPTLQFCVTVKPSQTRSFDERKNRRYILDDHVDDIVDVSITTLVAGDAITGCVSVSNQTSWNVTVNVSIKDEFKDCYEIEKTETPTLENVDEVEYTSYLDAFTKCSEHFVVYIQKKELKMKTVHHLNNFEDMPYGTHSQHVQLQKLDDLGIPVPLLDGGVPFGAAFEPNARFLFDKRIIATESSTQHKYLRRVEAEYIYYCGDEAQFSPTLVLDAYYNNYSKSTWICAEDPQAEGRDLYCDDVTDPTDDVRTITMDDDRIIQYEFASDFLVLGIAYKEQNNVYVWEDLIDRTTRGRFNQMEIGRKRVKMDYTITSGSASLPPASNASNAELRTLLHRKSGTCIILFNRLVDASTFAPASLSPDITGFFLDDTPNSQYRLDNLGAFKYHYAAGISGTGNTDLTAMPVRHSGADQLQHMRIVFRRRESNGSYNHACHQNLMRANILAGIESTTDMPLANPSRVNMKTDYPGLYFMIKSAGTTVHDFENCRDYGIPSLTDANADLLITHNFWHISTQHSISGWHGALDGADGSSSTYPNLDIEVYRVSKLNDGHLLMGSWTFVDEGNDAGLREDLDDIVKVASGSINIHDKPLKMILGGAVLVASEFIPAVKALKMGAKIAKDLLSTTACDSREIGTLGMVAGDFELDKWTPLFYNESDYNALKVDKLNLYGQGSGISSNFIFHSLHVGEDKAGITIYWLLGDM